MANFLKNPDQSPNVTEIVIFWHKTPISWAEMADSARLSRCSAILLTKVTGSIVICPSVFLEQLHFFTRVKKREHFGAGEIVNSVVGPIVDTS